jgi:cell division septum initiation protein DivIVA
MSEEQFEYCVLNRQFEQHVMAIVREARALRAEVERLRAELAGEQRSNERQANAIATLRAEVERLKKLIDPAVIAAAKLIERNADLHPTGCCHKCSIGLAQRDALLKALREIADNPLPAVKGYECAWCNRVRTHHENCPCSIAAAALASTDAAEGREARDER